MKTARGELGGRGVLPATRSWVWAAALLALAAGGLFAKAPKPKAATPKAAKPAAALRRVLDAPLLFVKRHSYRGYHIYDTYYRSKPGGGIYIIENPAADPCDYRVRPLVDANTPDSPGPGHYTDPDISWDARRVLFCYQKDVSSQTCIYEVAIDGRNLRRLTDPGRRACSYQRGRPQHDLSPAYLPDGRIVFTSTRPDGLVPCANRAVDILHVMDADGNDIHPISVNNVNEFDPAVMADGRVLFGRWEYVDKTALTQQSLWTVFPDGTNETALYANNMVHPMAILDARPVPGWPELVVGSFTGHNTPPRGTVAFIDTQAGKNDPNAIVNLDEPKRPTHDSGDSCEPWPISRDVVLYSARPKGYRRGVLVLADRAGRRLVVHEDAEFDCHSPMLIKPRPLPPVLAAGVERPRSADRPARRTGRLFVQDVYQGLPGIARGEVKCLRVIEETSRTGGTHGSAYNQTFLISGMLAFSAKTFLGLAPVEADGSAYFEVPSGRAIYLQALDAEMRLVQSMRTFVQAAPGVTRSCVGCHEYKYSAPPTGSSALALRRGPSRLAVESWGSGFIDYPTMVQPILDAHCASCHGGEKGFAAGLDLTGGWTEYFNISYENLTSRRKTQLTAHLIAGIDCMNGTSRWSARIFPPRAHGSGTAPLAKVLVSGHAGRIPRLTRTQRDLLLAWIDTNGVYHGTWDYSRHGCRAAAWAATRTALAKEMKAAGCTKCHGEGRGMLFESDWFNLRRPELSRILRAPLAKGAKGFGLASCRQAKADPRRQRIRILVGGYAHSDQPLRRYGPWPTAPAPEGEPVVTFAATDDAHYRAMLAIIRQGRTDALARPRVDMPQAESDLVAGGCRMLLPPPLPERLPVLTARADADGIVCLEWQRTAETIGLTAEVHRAGKADFPPTDETRLGETEAFRFADADAAEGTQHYAVVLRAADGRSRPIRASVRVPPPRPPGPPTALAAKAGYGQVALAWKPPPDRRIGYHVYRADADSNDFERVTDEPIDAPAYVDPGAAEGRPQEYRVRAVNRRGTEGPPTPVVACTAAAAPREAVFRAALAGDANGQLLGGEPAVGQLRGKAAVDANGLDCRKGGRATFAHRREFDLAGAMSLACWVRFEKPGRIPVVVACGHWRRAGWLLQKLGGRWRWHVGGLDCDGGKPPVGKWVHVVGTFDGRTARVYQDGRQVAKRAGRAGAAAWSGPLVVGQYQKASGGQFQVIGQIADVRLYVRALGAKEVAAAAREGRAKRPAEPAPPKAAPPKVPAPEKHAS